jgi:hypothetical protein
MCFMILVPWQTILGRFFQRLAFITQSMATKSAVIATLAI